MEKSQEILEYLIKVPHSKIVSYKFLSQKFWIHPRVVAKILSKNFEQNKYPCYKVVCNDWKIGWYNLWIEEKIRRLGKDWIKIENNKIHTKHFYKE
ncbi:MAG: Methylated-DNA-[protein]-cysteine S-methyltransferase DNA binding protein [uncultured bacterium (gcode 4)]|uniref:Methylated-DNA-[protein]-cysteine S-methyltransferase DNA binding protein n=1 Tax=uncultured bacterium (gcode 4) TaxID=1234023 RepID=K2FWR4_9BACT|nr:MAG: Methylated-DNA-[protein]-cysteine S-methyltransferase DNA binding protein [uncultured bacterium (gcode 4)]